MNRLKFNLWMFSGSILAVIVLLQTAFHWSAIGFSSFALICLSQGLRRK